MAEEGSPAPKVSVEASFEQDSGGKVGDRNSIRIKVTNRTDSPIDEQEIVLEANDYYDEAKGTLSTIEVNGVGETVLSVQPKANASARNLRDEIVIRLGGVAEKTFPIKTNFGHYNGGMAECKPPDETVEAYNVLFFGPPKSGKSSIVATTLTAFQSAKDSRVTHLDGESEHRFTRYSVTPHLNLWDSHGFTGNVYTRELADWFIDGKDECPASMHAVVFVMPQLDLIDLEEENVADMIDVFEYMMSRNCVPLIILSKVDETTSVQSSQPLENHENVVKLKREVAEVFDFEDDRVLVAMNYFKMADADTAERRCEIDALAYNNLEVVLHHCEGIVRKRFEKL